MKWFGAHVSAQGGAFQAVAHAHRIGASSFALFVKSQRRWKAPSLSKGEIEAFQEAMQHHSYDPSKILPHASYLINLGSAEPALRAKSLEALCEEMLRCKQLGITQLNLHPGTSLKKMSDQACLSQIAACLRFALSSVPSVSLILENTAGQGSQLGYRWEQLAQIISEVPDPLKDRVGVCFDSCHAFAAGYDLRTEKACEGTFMKFNEIIGFKWLKAMHLNDSKGHLGSRLDRHAPLGEGAIGWTAFRYIAQAPYFEGIPLILETPEPERWAKEIAQLKGFEAEVLP